MVVFINSDSMLSAFTHCYHIPYCFFWRSSQYIFANLKGVYLTWFLIIMKIFPMKKFYV